MSTSHVAPQAITPKSSDRVRIGLCTDTHYWPQGGNNIGSAGNIQLLGEGRKLLDSLCADLAAADLDLILHLGDFTCGGGYFNMPTEQFYAAVDIVHDALDRVAKPIRGLPGNHDCPPGGGRWTYAEECWGLARGLGQTIDLPCARLVLLNAQGHTDEQIEAAKPDDPIYGWVTDEELARFDHALATADDRPVIVCMHQLLKPWSGDQEWNDFYAVQNADAVLALIARRGNVCAVFQGHAHRFDVQYVDVNGHSVCFVITPAIVEYPLGWLALDLMEDQLHVRLRTLDLPELARLIRDAGDGQAWRAGRAEWQTFTMTIA